MSMGTGRMGRAEEEGQMKRIPDIMFGRAWLCGDPISADATTIRRARRAAQAIKDQRAQLKPRADWWRN